MDSNLRDQFCLYVDTETAEHTDRTSEENGRPGVGREEWNQENFIIARGQVEVRKRWLRAVTKIENCVMQYVISEGEAEEQNVKIKKGDIVLARETFVTKTDDHALKENSPVQGQPAPRVIVIALHKHYYQRSRATSAALDER